MDLDIETRQVALDPRTRDFIERAAARLVQRFAGILRLHVTLEHRGRRRLGLERVTLIARVQGRTVRVEKKERDGRFALRSAFLGLEAELLRRRRLDRGERAPRRARLRGRVVHIFEEEGMGTIRPETGPDVRFHRSSLHGLLFERLVPGVAVEFTLDERDDPPRAARVYPAEDSAVEPA